METYLAIDIGASSGRHIVGWLEDGRVCTREVYRFPNGATQRGAHLCWDADALLHHVVEGLRAAHAQGYTPTSIGIDTWAVDFAPLDAQGNLLGDLIAYRDGRTAGMDALLEQALPFAAHYRVAGIAKQPFNTVYQLMALLREHPEARDAVRDILLVPDYLGWRLTGVKACEWTNASTTALCDARTRSWSGDILRAADLPAHWFAASPRMPGETLGMLSPAIAEAVGFQSRVVLTATHDTGSAFMAVPAQDAHAAFLSSGTWSLLGTELSAPVTSDDARLAGFTNEGGYGGTTRFLKNIMGMWMLQCIHRETNGAHTFAEMAQMAADSTYPAYVDATDNRFLAPASMLHEVEDALREQGAPAPQGLGDVLRAVTMGLAVCYRDAIAQMERLTGQHFTSLNIVGGGSQNATLNRMTAALTGLPVLAGPTEGTALGNLAAQMLAAGALPSLAAFRETLTRSFPIARFDPC